MVLATLWKEIFSSLSWIQRSYFPPSTTSHSSLACLNITSKPSELLASDINSPFSVFLSSLLQLIDQRQQSTSQSSTSSGSIALYLTRILSLLNTATTPSEQQPCVQSCSIVQLVRYNSITLIVFFQHLNFAWWESFNPSSITLSELIHLLLAGSCCQAAQFPNHSAEVFGLSIQICKSNMSSSWIYTFVFVFQPLSCRLNEIECQAELYPLLHGQHQPSPRLHTYCDHIHWAWQNIFWREHRYR